jgi:hypothetical protein
MRALKFMLMLLICILIINCDTVSEVPVVTVPLAGPIANDWAEVSGLCWYKDHLILLPQYPGRFNSSNQGKLFAIPKERILSYLADPDGTAAIKPLEIEWIAPGLKEKIRGFEGYEAIAVWGDRVFVTIEAETFLGELTGYLVSGKIEPDLSRVTIDTKGPPVKIEAQSGLPNYTEESLFVTEDRVLTIHEANGLNVNDSPVVHVFTHSLEPAGTLPFPVVEYRITDATAIDKKGVFWCLNYSWKGDIGKLDPAEDSLFNRYGIGYTHKKSMRVERLVALRYTPEGIKSEPTAPVQLQLPELARNWEGIVRLDGRGFLIVTDEHPGTILAFVKTKE